MRPVRFSVLLPAVLLLLAASPAALAATGFAGASAAVSSVLGYAPGDLIVKFRGGTAPERVRAVVASQGASLKQDPEWDGLSFLTLGAGADVFEAMARFERLPEVEYAAPNLAAEAFFVPNDSLISQSDLTWSLRSVGAYDAWDVVTGSPSVVLAIIDTGVAYEDHPIPDYERGKVRSITTTYRESPELPGPFRPGWDFVNDDAHPNDDAGHGTQVATVAAGAANNVAGSAGIAFGVSILPVKVLDFNGRGRNGGGMKEIVQGIRFAADQGADIANLSLGFPPLDRFLKAGITRDSLMHFLAPLRDAVGYARRRGTVLVAAAGNFAVDEVSLPAGYPGVIAVGSTGYSGILADYSSYGTGLTFVAPGGTDLDENGDRYADHIPVLSFKPNWTGESAEEFLAIPDSFVVWHGIGTSFAAAHVSGAVALLMSLGLKDQTSIEQVLKSTAVMPAGKPGGWNMKYGFGLIQIDKAVRASVSGPGGHAAAALGREPLGVRITSGNPARGEATISFRTARAGPVAARVYDARGTLVRTLTREERPAGEQSLRWDGRDAGGAPAASGVYFIRVDTAEGTSVRKLAYLR